MAVADFKPGSLVLYKIRPARVVNVDDKIEIELDSSKNKRVRDKDIELLHPGPIRSLSELKPCNGNIEEAWELLQGEESSLQELAELIYGEITPSSVWAAWEILSEGLYFEGTSDRVTARSEQAIKEDIANREAKEKAEAEWAGFLERLQKKTLDPDDRKRLIEVEKVALGQSDVSRILQSLGHQQTKENAHRLLTETGYWPTEHNLHPGREGVTEESPTGEVGELSRDENRIDLTHLAAYAIDDEGNQDPDDAISIEGNRLWVHVADVAALVRAETPMDLEARERGANLYLPEKIVTMLPQQVTDVLGLGLSETSPALSIAFDVLESGTIENIEIELSQVKVQRRTYQEVDRMLDEEPFKQLAAITAQYAVRRKENGATSIDLPEVITKVSQGTVTISPMERNGSREMVTNAMLMAGEAVALYCQTSEIPIPYATQAAPEKSDASDPVTLADMYAFRRTLKPSKLSVDADQHFGLGLSSYTRATSPLRRYSDLLVHQQLRAHILSDTLLSASEVATRMDGAEQQSRKIRRAERFSNQHWKLVFLQQNPNWKGVGTVVEKDGPKVTILISELAMETKLRSNQELALNDTVTLKIRQVDLPDQRAYFRILE